MFAVVGKVNIQTPYAPDIDNIHRSVYTRWVELFMGIQTGNVSIDRSVI